MGMSGKRGKRGGQSSGARGKAPGGKAPSRKGKGAKGKGKGKAKRSGVSARERETLSAVATSALLDGLALLPDVPPKVQAMVIDWLEAFWAQMKVYAACQKLEGAMEEIDSTLTKHGRYLSKKAKAKLQALGESLWRQYVELGC